MEADCSGVPLNPVDQDDDAAEPPEGDEEPSIAPEVDNAADEEEAVMRRLCVAGTAMMHPLKERCLGKYQAAMVASWSTD